MLIAVILICYAVGVPAARLSDDVLNNLFNFDPNADYDYTPIEIGTRGENSKNLPFNGVISTRSQSDEHDFESKNEESNDEDDSYATRESNDDESSATSNEEYESFAISNEEYESSATSYEEYESSATSYEDDPSATRESCEENDSSEYDTFEENNQILKPEIDALCIKFPSFCNYFDGFHLEFRNRHFVTTLTTCGFKSGQYMTSCGEKENVLYCVAKSAAFYLNCVTNDGDGPMDYQYYYRTSEPNDKGLGRRKPSDLEGSTELTRTPEECVKELAASLLHCFVKVENDEDLSKLPTKCIKDQFKRFVKCLM